MKKRTIVTGVKFISKATISQGECSSEYSKPISVLFPRKQNKKVSQNSKNVFKIKTREAFRVNKKKANCSFYLKNIQIHLLNNQKQNHKKH